MASQTISIQAGTLKTYVNRACVFITKTKIGVQPMFASLLWKEDKCYVFNGETGAVISLPFRLDQPIVFLPFDLQSALNASHPDSPAEIVIDYDKTEFRIKTSSIKIKFRVTGPELWPDNKPPEAPIKVTLENDLFTERLKRANSFTDPDASMTQLQSVQFTPTHVCATNQILVWREKATSSHSFLVSKVFTEQIIKMGLEPTSVGITDPCLVLNYADMILWGARVAEEDKFLPVNRALDAAVASPNGSEIEYDRETFYAKLTILVDLLEGDKVLNLTCKNGELLVQNIITNEYRSGNSDPGKVD